MQQSNYPQKELKGGLKNITIDSYMNIRSSLKNNNKQLDYYLQFQLTQLVQFDRQNSGKTDMFLSIMFYCVFKPLIAEEGKNFTLEAYFIITILELSTLPHHKQ